MGADGLAKQIGCYCDALAGRDDFSDLDVDELRRLFKEVDRLAILVSAALALTAELESVKQSQQAEWELVTERAKHRGR